MTPSKGKPGGQGSLFSVGDKDALLNPAQRWPRGYTPERQREVGEALDGPGMVHGRPNVSVVDTRGSSVSNHSFRAWVRGTLARSTVPVEHLRNLDRVDTSPNPDTYGTYWQANRRLAVNPDLPGDKSGVTLLHELGHHHGFGTKEGLETVANAIRPETIAKAAQTEANKSFRGQTFGPSATDNAMAYAAVRRGANEGYADNYAVEHYRAPGRKGERLEQGAYESNPNFAGDKLDKHYPGYRDVRPGSHMGPQFSSDTLF